MLKYGIQEYIVSNMDMTPFGIVGGSSGNGKSYLISAIAARAVMLDPTVQLIVLDYKNSSDFDYLDNVPNARYYTFDKVHDGIQQLWNILLKRQRKEDTSNNRIIGIIDELASFLNYMSGSGMDKKLAEMDKQIISNIGMLGRVFKINLFLSQQRFDSTYWGAGGGRENFISSGYVISLGNASLEAYKMLYPDFYSELVGIPRKRGTGFVSINGNKPIRVISPSVNMDKVRELITLGATR